MCKCFFIFLIFAFVQIQLRWQRDESYQWSVSLLGTGSCPVQFTHKFVSGHPPIYIHHDYVEFLQPHEIFVYTNGTAYMDKKRLTVHGYAKKGSIIKVNANDTVYLDIVSGIAKDLFYIPLYKH